MIPHPHPQGSHCFYSTSEQKLINDVFQKSFTVDSYSERICYNVKECPVSHGHPMNFQMNALDSLGQTALHRAALAGHLQTCRLLLSYGSDPSIISLQGFTAAQMGNEAVQQILSGESRGLSSLSSRPLPREQTLPPVLSSFMGDLLGRNASSSHISFPT